MFATETTLPLSATSDQFKSVFGCAIVGIFLVVVMVGDALGRIIAGAVVGGVMGFWLSRPVRVPDSKPTPDIPMGLIKIRHFRSTK